MKIRRMYRQIAALTAASLLAGLPLPVRAAAEETPELRDSGISYDEYVGTIANPAAGYTTTSWYSLSPGEEKIISPTGSLVLFFINIGSYSSGVNGTTTENSDGTKTYTEGTDYDLDDSFFSSLRGTFENCRKNGCMIALRIRYDANGKDNPEPSTFDQVLRHIQQIKDSHILEDYSDILALVESGTVGKWGEQHGGKYTTLDYKAQVLDAWLSAVPEDIPVTVRTPDIFAKWAGIERSQLADESVLEAAELSSISTNHRVLSGRVGLYNDGYMGSSSDLGTFANRDIETAWLNRVCTTSYYGGEFSGAIDFAKQYDTYLPENAIPEMYYTHLSYINGNIFQLYKDYTFGEAYDVEGADNSAYYGQNVFQFIRDHIGYRFVVRKSELSESVEQGGDFGLHMSIENTGFANPIPRVNPYIILEKDGYFLKSELPGIDPNKWYSCTTSGISESISVPGGLPAGDWNVYLKLTMGVNDLDQEGMRSIRFANSGIWNASLGANYVGSIKVTESNTPSTSLYFGSSAETWRSSDTGTVRTVRGQITADGMISSEFEWTEDMLIGENGDNKVYMTADEDNIYIMGQLPDGADAPVYNLRLTRADGESYWIYYQSNGFVYFNHDGRGGDSCKYSGTTVEFRIPLTMMGLQSGTELSLIRLFLQDSANDWKVLGEVNSGECIVPAGFGVYNGCTDIYLAEGSTYTSKPLTMPMSASYQWYKDGEEIEGAVRRDYTITGGSGSQGTYSVKITSDSGAEKIVEVTRVLESSEEQLIPFYGDANVDTKVNIADAVAVLQFIANSQKYPLTDQGQLNADCDGVSGITGQDAVTIQCVDAGLLKQTDLPAAYK